MNPLRFLRNANSSSMQERRCRGHVSRDAAAAASVTVAAAGQAYSLEGLPLCASFSFFMRLQRSCLLTGTAPCPTGPSRSQVPPALNRFTRTLDKNMAESLFKLLMKYRPEDKAAKKERLLKEAQVRWRGGRGWMGLAGQQERPAEAGLLLAPIAIQAAPQHCHCCRHATAAQLWSGCLPQHCHPPH